MKMKYTIYTYIILMGIWLMGNCSEECKKEVPVVLIIISMHSCSLDARIKMNLGRCCCVMLDMAKWLGQVNRVASQNGSF